MVQATAARMLEVEHAIQRAIHDHDATKLDAVVHPEPTQICPLIGATELCPSAEDIDPAFSQAVAAHADQSHSPDTTLLELAQLALESGGQAAWVNALDAKATAELSRAAAMQASAFRHAADARRVVNNLQGRAISRELTLSENQRIDDLAADPNGWVDLRHHRPADPINTAAFESLSPDGKKALAERAAKIGQGGVLISMLYSEAAGVAVDGMRSFKVRDRQRLFDFWLNDSKGRPSFAREDFLPGGLNSSQHQFFKAGLQDAVGRFVDSVRKR